MTKTFETLIVETRDNVGLITLNRPEKKNALNPRLHEEMNTALDALVEDDEVRVIILTGAGDSFCAGNDLKEFFADQVDQPSQFRRNSRRFTQWREKLRTCPKPTIAAINGWCLGAGLSVICVADFAIAAEEAMFGLPEVNFGVFPAGGATKGPLELLSHRDALELILTGKNISAREAERMRLVNRCVPRDRLMAECLALAEELKQKDPVALMIAKEAFWLVKLQEYPEALDVEAGKHRELHFLQQGRWLSKGIGRFLAKRYKPSESSYMSVPPEEAGPGRS
jgi:trans-feruloyl-CoA hydratase/vanillin synthase